MFGLNALNNTILSDIGVDGCVVVIDVVVVVVVAYSKISCGDHLVVAVK